MNRILNKIIILTFLLFSTQLFGQWNKVSENLPQWTGGITLDASDENTAIICVTGTADITKVFLTSDAGQNWQSINFSNEIFPVDVSIIDKNNFWIVTGDGEIYSTDNGGSHWILQYSNNSRAEVINYIEMFDTLYGVAMGDGVANNPADKIAPAIVLKTNNCGETWEPLVDITFSGYSGDTWRRIDFVDTTVGYFFVSGVEPQQLYKTKDGGESWHPTNFTDYASIIKFYDKSIGLIANQDGGLFRTANGGDSWTNIQLNTGWGNDIEFLPNDPSKVWFATKQLFYSSDSGFTWDDYTFTNGEVYLRDIVFVDNYNGWILTDSALYRTTNNGGIVVSVQHEEIVPNQFELKQNYPNPFNPTTKIEYVIPDVEMFRERPTKTELKIYNILGSEISTIVNTKHSPGKYSVDFNAAKLPSGVYIYVLESGKNKIAKKMTLMK